MKLNKYIWMAVLPMAFTACQEEVMVEEYPLDLAVHTISCSIGGEQVEGRAQIVLGNKNRENEIFHWNANDQFTLFQTWYTQTDEDGRIDHNTQYTYTIDESYNDAEPKGTANFTSIGSDVSNSSSDDINWIAFYPTTDIDETIEKYGKFCTLTIDGSITNNSEESWNEYFKKNMYMRAYGDDNTLPSSIFFEHLCGIVRITYTNATQADHKLKGIYVDGTLGNKQEYEIAYIESGTSYEKSALGTSNMHGLTFTDKATIAAGTSQDFYILFFPPQATEGTELQNMKGIKVDYGIDGVSSMSQTPTQYFYNDFEYSGFMAGKCYWFKITGLDNERIVWTRDYKPEDEEEQPGTDDTVIDEATKRFYEDLNDPSVTEIVLQSPVTLNGNVDLQGKTVTLSSDFFIVNTNAIAAINYHGKTAIEICNGKIIGNISDSGKYLFQVSSTNAPWVTLTEVEFQANGSLNAISVIDSRIRPQAGTIIESVNGYALDMTAKNEIVFMEITDAEILDKVRFNLNNTDGNASRVIIDGETSIEGALEVTGNGTLKIDNNAMITLPESWNTYLNNESSTPEMELLVGETISFENEAFHNALYELWGSNFVGVDSDGNRVISKTKADTETQIIFNDVTSNVAAIQTLSGIEKFPNLTTFVIHSSKEARLKIEEADFTKNTQMEEITISQGQLVSLNVKGLTNLSVLYCSGNSNLANIDLTGCTSLTNVNVYNTAISTLSIPDPSKLSYLDCGKTNITELNLSSFSSLISLTAGECDKLKTLILPDEDSNLGVLTLTHTKINGTLDLSKYSQLYRLYCFDCGITDLKLNSNCDFQYISCYLNQISSLNLGKSESLENIYCGQQGTPDEEGNYAVMELTLPASKYDMWNETLSKNDFNKGVVLAE